MQRELGAAIAPYTTRLWELKGQQLRAFRDSADAGPATVELRRLARKMTAELDQFLQKRSAAFAGVDMPIDAAGEVVHVALDRLFYTKNPARTNFEGPPDTPPRLPPPRPPLFPPPGAAPP